MLSSLWSSEFVKYGSPGVGVAECRAFLYRPAELAISTGSNTHRFVYCRYVAYVRASLSIRRLKLYDSPISLDIASLARLFSMQ